MENLRTDNIVIFGDVIESLINYVNEQWDKTYVREDVKDIMIGSTFTNIKLGDNYYCMATEFKFCEPKVLKMNKKTGKYE